ncbi:hypothetical protein SAY86_016344 [Trapa natans]|uniref:Transmembrane protein n=1 Tax=Trapa natans TaxID=22666 RepID=A0AAN7LL94_TRANT|nr:hypothetical protein SAY86_016344 [Trapa natans]
MGCPVKRLHENVNQVSGLPLILRGNTNLSASCRCCGDFGGDESSAVAVGEEFQWPSLLLLLHLRLRPLFSREPEASRSPLHLSLIAPARFLRGGPRPFSPCRPERRTRTHRMWVYGGVQVNKYDEKWEKQWFGAGIFYEGSEEVEVDVFKKLEKRKVLSNVEKAGLLSKAEDLGFTLSSIEKLGVFSKAEELGLLSLLEKVAGTSPSVLASSALPILVAAIAAVVLIPDDNTGLLVVKALVAGALTVGAAGLFVGSVILGGLQEAD